jgi:cytochrome c2
MHSLAAVFVSSAAFVLAALSANGQPPDQGGTWNFGGDPARGVALIRDYGCGSCHQIPGVADADGLVGPPLSNIGVRVYLAGMLRNTPDNLMLWLRHPQQIVPGNVMPDMGMTVPDARDIATYLYTLRH